MIADVLGWIGACLGLAISLPQVILVVRTGSTHGLSLVTWVITLGTGLAWTGHGIKLAEQPQIWPNIVTWIATCTILYYLHRNGRFRSWKVVLPGLALGIGLICIDNFISATAFGACVIFPQAFGILKQGIALMRAPLVTGVSPMAWVLQVTNQGVWLTWALLSREPGIGISAAVSLVCGAFVLTWRILRMKGLGPISEWPSTKAREARKAQKAQKAQKVPLTS
ncbi:MAG: hypothetical protein LBN10_01280 [Propionibacteriaceae bacterium]|nr:hypothetical protein [Propionibacteriaceae bacterium]